MSPSNVRPAALAAAGILCGAFASAQTVGVGVLGPFSGLFVH